MPEKSEESPLELLPKGSVRVTFFAADEDISRLIWEYAHMPHVRTRVIPLLSLSELSFVEERMQGVLVVDITEQCDVESLLSANARLAISECEIIVLCSHTDANFWLDMALREEIGDYHIVRPLEDPGNLKLKIWRAIERGARRAKPNANGQIPALSSGDTPAQIPAQQETSGKGPFAGKRALILEDDPASAEAIEDMLASEGFDVSAADSVKKAFSRFGEQPFDVILLDLMMPGISGPAAVKTIREKFKSTEAPIIVTTAYSERDLVKECLREGAIDYLLKPIKRRTLLPRIALALGRQLNEAQQQGVGDRDVQPQMTENSLEQENDGQ